MRVGRNNCPKATRTWNQQLERWRPQRQIPMSLWRRWHKACSTKNWRPRCCSMVDMLPKLKDLPTNLPEGLSGLYQPNGKIGRALLSTQLDKDPGHTTRALCASGPSPLGSTPSPLFPNSGQDCGVAMSSPAGGKLVCGQLRVPAFLARCLDASVWDGRISNRTDRPLHFLALPFGREPSYR